MFWTASISAAGATDTKREQPSSRRGVRSEEAALCVVGDTPNDIQAARANGLKVIAVATGIYSYEKLAAEQPDMLLRSLTQLELAAA